MKTIDAPSTLHRSYDENDTTNAHAKTMDFFCLLATYSSKHDLYKK